MAATRRWLGQLAAAAGALGLLGAAGAWARGVSRQLEAIERDAERALAPLRAERAALEQAGPAALPLRPLLDVYADALALVDRLLPALDLDGDVDLPRGGLGTLAKTFRPSEWPDVGTVDLAIALGFWTYPGIVRLLDTLLAELPATLTRLTLAEGKASLVLTLYGETAPGRRLAAAGGTEEAS